MNLISIKDAAKMLSVHRNTIRNWIRDGKLDVIRITNRTHRIDMEQIQKLKEQQ